ncbi:prenyltransferase/squalene oxidase repeat-containing protein [Crateriforma spongiae]|uniref:prenyltransferase/squalene oxidase repeat-containing protein n=1 Tax=Crateriforma spongiae TaxID=2724528 RepID=UPI001447D213|nr:prenyltransferase/squalene oxidase repeat-containing protein [Crateriforma spongiae]
MNWKTRVLEYINSLRIKDDAGFASVEGKRRTVYGTGYALQTLHFLNALDNSHNNDLDWLLDCQDAESGWFVGDEFSTIPKGQQHDISHLSLHLTCSSALPAIDNMGARPTHPFRSFERFLDRTHLLQWLNERDLSNPWYEGNNLLFVGQLIDWHQRIEAGKEWKERLRDWFDFHDQHFDIETGMWGTDEGASTRAAMCGAYHQLILYWHHSHPVNHWQRLIDCTLSLQHADGGFSETLGGGACEDIDAIDILVNCYHRFDYRRSEIRDALLAARRLILSIQNPDGGFPYKRGATNVHMGMKDTRTSRGGSGIFPTWFRVHALALIDRVVQQENFGMQFNNSVCMGGYCQPEGKLLPCSVSLSEQERLRRRVRNDKLTRAVKEYSKLTLKLPFRAVKRLLATG